MVSVGRHHRLAASRCGIVGSNIDFKRDLGLQDQHLQAVKVVLRPARSHKFRFQYIPITYDSIGHAWPRTSSSTASATVSALPVNSTLDWKAYRFGYEYDFVTKNRGFVGFIMEAKYTDVQVQLASPVRGRVRARARADSGARRHRTLLRGAEHLDHR